MKIIHVSVAIKPEENEQFVSAIGQFEIEARQFSGCQKFIVSQVLADHARYEIYEEWESGAAFQKYEQSDSFRRFRESLGPLFAGPPSSDRYEVLMPLT